MQEASLLCHQLQLRLLRYGNYDKAAVTLLRQSQFGCSVCGVKSLRSTPHCKRRNDRLSRDAENFQIAWRELVCLCHPNGRHRSMMIQHSFCLIASFKASDVTDAAIKKQAFFISDSGRFHENGN